MNCPSIISREKKLFSCFFLLTSWFFLAFFFAYFTSTEGAYFLIEVCNVFLKGKIEFRYNDKNDNFS